MNKILEKDWPWIVGTVVGFVVFLTNTFKFSTSIWSWIGLCLFGISGSMLRWGLESRGRFKSKIEARMTCLGLFVWAGVAVVFSLVTNEWLHKNPLAMAIWFCLGIAVPGINICAGPKYSDIRTSL